MSAVRIQQGVNQSVTTTTTTSTNSTGFGAATTQILVSVDGNTYIDVGENPNAGTAGQTGFLVKATDPPLRLSVAPGEKLAARGASAATHVSIVELTNR